MGRQDTLQETVKQRCQHKTGGIVTEEMVTEEMDLEAMDVVVTGRDQITTVATEIIRNDEVVEELGVEVVIPGRDPVRRFVRTPVRKRKRDQRKHKL